MVSAYCYAHNTRSRRVLEKCGLVWEGTLRRCAGFEGTVYDELCFSLLREEASDR